MDTYQILSTENPIFKVYVTWTGFLIIKMLLMSVLTGTQRLITKVILMITIINSLNFLIHHCILIIILINAI